MVKKNKEVGYTKDDSALYEYYFKLRKIKDRVLTKGGKKIAKERHDFMVKFFSRFENEIEGKL